MKNKNTLWMMSIWDVMNDKTRSDENMILKNKNNAYTGHSLKYQGPV